MAKFYPSISDELQDFIKEQHLFFVASAPLDTNGHVNISPKGMDSLRIFSANQVAYLDLTGSGNETSAHLRENGRITVMFCAFNGAPRILRLYGTGRTILPDTPDWDEFSQDFTLYAGVRQIIVIDVTLVQTSCGYAVPLYEYIDDRDTLIRWAEAKGDKLEDYWEEKNACSLDALPTPLGLQLQEKER